MRSTVDHRLGGHHQPQPDLHGSTTRSSDGADLLTNAPTTFTLAYDIEDDTRSPVRRTGRIDLTPAVISRE